MPVPARPRLPSFGYEAGAEASEGRGRSSLDDVPHLDALRRCGLDFDLLVRLITAMAEYGWRSWRFAHGEKMSSNAIAKDSTE